MMESADSAGYLSGPGWQGARIPLLGDELALTVVRPDRDLDALLVTLKTTSGLAALLRTEPTAFVDLTLPTFTIRSTVDLVPPLAGLGLTTAFSDAAEFPGLTKTRPLKLQAAKQMGYLALTRTASRPPPRLSSQPWPPAAQPDPDHELVLNRPFLFVLHDIALALPLVTGVVVDPR